MTTERRLFEIAEYRTSSDSKVSTDHSASFVVRVVPDVAGIDKVFDYAVPEPMLRDVELGTIVSVRLNGRTVEAWVVETDVTADPSITLRPIERVVSRGPTEEIVMLTRWAASRWAGRHRALLRSASPKRRVSHWPRERAGSSPAPFDRTPAISQLVERIQAGAALSGVVTGAAQPTLDILRPLIADVGGALVIVPTTARARYFSGQLQRAGIRSHLYERQWETGMSGGVVVGSRSSVWAPLAESIKLIVVVDEHDEALQEERNPTWHARDVAIERARRRGARCVLLSPCLSLTAREHTAQVHTLARTQQRASWPIIDLIDRRAEEPNRYGLFSPQVVQALRDTKSGLAVLNRTGRSVMLACQQCGELVRSIDGQHLMVERNGELHCKATGETRPLVCAVCTGTSLKRLRLGIGKAAEELTALIGEPISEVTGKEKGDVSSRVAIGTEAALYRVKRADVVVFLDFDQELLASRYLVAEQAMGLLVRACRLVGGRSKNPAARVLVQTRVPEHRVLEAAAKADSSRMVETERTTRSALGLPPFGALAEVSKAGAAEYVAAAKDLVGSDPSRWPNVITMGPKPDGSYLLRAETTTDLAELLAEVEQPKQRVRVAVDPPQA